MKKRYILALHQASSGFGNEKSIEKKIITRKINIENDQTKRKYQSEDIPKDHLRSINWIDLKV